MKPFSKGLHCGLNDLRCMNVNELDPDYSNFHAPGLYDALGFNQNNFQYKLASIKLLNIIGRKMKLIPKYPYEDQIVQKNIIEETDSKAIDYFKNNILTLSQLHKTKGIEIIYVPQIIVEENINKGQYKWWVPYLSEDSFITQLDNYNNILLSTSKIDSSLFINSILEHPWKQEDFVDQSHLNSEGNLIFAKYIAKEIISKY